MASSASRVPVIDAIKAVACLSIVLHHLAFYGPMSEVARPLMPGLLDWLYHYGRMAVMGFFVVSGFLTARAFAPDGMALLARPWPAIRQRYLRLALPFLAAIMLAIGCAAIARAWLPHESVPGSPTLPQLLAHVALSNGLLGQESLFAGVWYVGIDFQLFSVLALLAWISQAAGRRYPPARWAGAAAIGALTLASLFVFNRNAYWDETALYFFAYYGLGCGAYWLTGRPGGGLLLAGMAAIVAVALIVDFRARVLVAAELMLLLGGMRQAGVLESVRVPAVLSRLARISYSVFLVHFPLCLLVSAAFFHFFPQSVAANAAGMAVAVAVSLAGGALFHRLVEQRTLDPAVRRGILASVALGAVAVMAR
ncbi:glucans biosynthesis protein [Pigmentiphaga humi]|uniref:Glucans biosynthesis protein n=1 Tax=Pigmentiphaga humi TaxID=2478468 RepID=A0A3P4B9D5_9BURK|nr:acyltransferase [Pigmentiphaga humi]VCU71755.1 glucans biosynthesis protein [Pigmentiphaga humi]